MPDVKRRTIRQKRGTEGERIAQEYLTGLNYKILKTNEYTHWGEIDIIAKTSDEIMVFIEVRTKGGTRWGTPEDSFNYRKQKRIRRAIEWYCLKHNIPENRMRIDLVAIEYTDEGTKLRHYKNVSLT